MQEKELHLGVIQARKTTHSVIAWTDEQGVVEIETRARHGLMTPLSVGQSLCFLRSLLRVIEGRRPIVILGKFVNGGVWERRCHGRRRRCRFRVRHGGW